MNQEELIERWKQEEQKPFSGWDFSYLEGRMIEDQPPWSYQQRAVELMKGSTALLDMSTGGGEKLLALQDDWPDKVVATEDYPPQSRAGAGASWPLSLYFAPQKLNRE